MIRLTVNLARRPAENFRRVWMLWGGSLALLGVLFLTLATVAAVGWLHSREIGQQTAAVKAEMAPLLARQESWRRQLNDPQVRAAFTQAEFFNHLIDRKSISWTLLFERLENILPLQVQLVSLKPMERSNGTAVDLVVATDDLPEAIDFVRALETSGDFANATVVHQSFRPHPAGRAGIEESKLPLYQVEITASYTPKEGAASGAVPSPSAGSSAGATAAEPARSPSDSGNSRLTAAGERQP